MHGTVCSNAVKSIISIENLNKVYEGGFQALQDVSLDIHAGEIFGLLGPNGAGKTTLIGVICGIVNASSGKVSVDSYDIVKDFRKARKCIGLVPQELSTHAFETVWNTTVFTRGVFGKKPNAPYIEDLLKRLSLWDKKDEQLRNLSGGMKRRVLIAKALSHEPKVLFLDEPTAGVDVELRSSLLAEVKKLKELGVTVILTTHYLEEAEKLADRIGVINQGKLGVVEEKEALMKKLGTKKLKLTLKNSIEHIPDTLKNFHLERSDDGKVLTYTYEKKSNESGIPELLSSLSKNEIQYTDLKTQESSLEDIFIRLVHSQ